MLHQILNYHISIALTRNCSREAQIISIGHQKISKKQSILLNQVMISCNQTETKSIPSNKPIFFKNSKVTNLVKKWDKEKQAKSQIERFESCIWQWSSSGDHASIDSLLWRTHDNKLAT